MHGNCWADSLGVGVMKERPILFSGPMVRAILDGRKTQTRRIIKDHFYYGCLTGDCPHDKQAECDMSMGAECPYGQPGHRLWVRETWRPEELDAQGHDEIGDAMGDYPDGTDGIRYQADDEFMPIENSAKASDRWHELLRPRETWPELRPTVWRPSIHMPRWASRITLQITRVRVARLQEINGADAAAEGVRSELAEQGGVGPAGSYRDNFRLLWDSIYAKRGHGWETNPWVWVIEFRQEPAHTGAHSSLRAGLYTNNAQ